jgi:hypothetical protein
MNTAEPTQRYRIRLKSSHGSGVPVPDFGKRCVCCNAPTIEQLKARISNSDLYHISGPILLPTCPDCKFHVHWRHMFWDKVLGYGGGFGWVILILVLAGQDIGSLKYGTLILIPWTAYMFYNYVFSRRMGGAGHHSGIEVYVSERELDIRTGNRALAERLQSAVETRSGVEVVVKPALGKPAKGFN